MSEDLNSRLQRIEDALKDIRRLVGPFGVPMGDGVTLVQSLYGVKYLIPTSDDVMAPNLIVYRQWESDVSAAMVGLVDKDAVFVDVGANFGYFTCLIASYIGQHGSGCVFAFEPNPDSLALLKRNLGINWSMAPIRLIEKAASDAVGTTRFARPLSRSANATMLTADANAQDAETITVDVTTLDAALPPGQRVDVIKIDVEGWELNVLKGAARVLNENPNVKIIMEWSRKQMLEASIDPDSLYDYIVKFGYSIFDVADGAELQRATMPNYANLLIKRRAP